MAYNQHEAYEPPRRGYQAAPRSAQQAAYDQVSSPYDQRDPYEQQQRYGRHEQSAPPVRQDYYQPEDGRRAMGRAGPEPKQDYNRAYDQGRQQQREAEYARYQETSRSPQRTMRDDNHYDARDRQYQGHGNQHTSPDRAYDPRFQPRAPPPSQNRGPNGPQSRSNGPPSQQTHGTSGFSPQRGDPRRQMQSNGYPPQDQYQQRQQQQQPAQSRPPLPNDYDSHQYAQSQSPQAYDSQQQRRPEPTSQRSQEPPKNSMAEWKAREKAKLQGMRPPETVAQDNAFPSFGKKEKRAPGDRSGGTSAMSHRSGENADSLQRPSSERGQSYGNERTDSKDLQHVRPQLEKMQSSDHGANWPMRDERPSSRHNGNGRQQTQHDHTASPAWSQPSEQWPMKDSTAHPTRSDDSRSPPQTSTPNNRPPAGRTQFTGDMRQQRPRSPPRREAPPLQPLDTAAPVQRPAYYDPKPQSPANAHSGRDLAAATQPFSPASQYSQSIMPSPASAYAAPKPWMSQTGNSGEINAPVRRQTREQQIEDDMPNFDSAAPNQGSNSARPQSNDRQPYAPATSGPGGPAYAGSNYQPVSSPQATGPYDAHYGATSGRRPMDAVPSRADANTVPPRPVDQRTQYGNPRQVDAQAGYGGEYSDPGMQPPRAPFANGQPVRRSMDDGQQLPYRPGMPGRTGPNSTMAGNPSPGGSYNEMSQRPDFDRNQTTSSDPGQRRAPSAPPGRQGYLAPGGGVNGEPLSQQRSAPDQMPMPYGNPDALPRHPMPVRPGLAQQNLPQQQNGSVQPGRPPPTRTYDVRPGASAPVEHNRQPSVDAFAEPVTKAELARLLADLEANPYSNKRALIYAKKLVEASTVLASEGGRADARTAAKNRERYINDAFKRVKKLVSAGYPEAQFYLADCYGQGSLGLGVDTKEAFNLYQAAAKAGHPQAAYRTAVCCEMGPEEGGGTRRDYPKAVQWYRRAATLGDSAAMFKIGVVLLKGLLGEQKNISEAINWLKRAAERADNDTPHALHELAALYETSNTTPEVRNKIVADDKYALELLQKAAGLGYKFSQFRLGQAYEYGQLGLQIDNRLSITWYTKAAAQGEHQAELALSGWYLTGADNILEHNDTEAYLWARKAAMSEPPLAKAMFAMGYFTENGIGCPASMDEAKKWYGRAAYYKFPKALERLEEMKKNPGKGRSAPGSGKLSRKDQKRDEAECVVM